jgi:hypothetical protein
VQYVLEVTDNGCSTYEEGEAFWFMQGPELPSSTSCNDCCLLYLQIERERKKEVRMRGEREGNESEKQKNRGER